MCPATSPSHSDMNQHCQVSNDLISFAHRAVLNPKVSSFVALYSSVIDLVRTAHITGKGNYFYYIIYHLAISHVEKTHSSSRKNGTFQI